MVSSTIRRGGELIMIGGLTGGFACGQKGSVQAIGGSEVPGVTTFKPGLICCPPMIVGPRVTLSGPTLGGTNKNRGDAATDGDDAVGVVSARAPATGAASANGMRTAAAADNLRIRIRISF
jgi:hypothetical protein